MLQPFRKPGSNEIELSVWVLIFQSVPLGSITLSRTEKTLLNCVSLRSECFHRVVKGATEYLIVTLVYTKSDFQAKSAKFLR
jgi:hypothetical protein